MKIRNVRQGMKLLGYFVIAATVIVWLMFVINFIFLFVLAYRFHQADPDYIGGGEIMEELALTDAGYELDGVCQERLRENGQWAMLLDQDGRVIWSCDKPEEVKDSYSRSDIARMSKWYLEGYPVRMRVWDDRIMVVGKARDSAWKYTLEFPISWLTYIKRVWFRILLFDFLWILAVIIFFTRRWSVGKEQARIEWIAGISHDIRTPLAMVMGYADTLADSGNLSEEEREQMAVIRRQSMIMKELIADLNLTSRLEYSMQPLRAEKVRPTAVVREVAAEFLSDAGEGTLEIEVEISEQAERMWIRADEKMLVRAIRNLFHNSIQHGGGEETMVIRLRVWRERRRCCISFADNGVGYAPEVLRGLRQRGKKRAAQNIRGLGIVQKIVLAHGGRITFRNNEEGGSFCEMRFREYYIKSK